jgi:hypothetical protein
MLSPDANADSANGCDRPAVPPFRVVYLGLWAAVAVAWIAMSLAADAVFGRIDTKVGPCSGRIIQGVSDVGFGAVLVGAGIAIRFAWATGIRSLRPGHWILVNGAMLNVFGALLSPIWRWNWPSESSTDRMMLVAGLTQAMYGFLFLYALVKLDDVQSWKSSFAAIAIAELAVGVISLLLAWREKPIVAGALMMVLGLGGLVFFLFAVVSIFAAIADDLRRKSRDWLHWVGVAALASAPLTQGLWGLARWLHLP